MRRIEEKDLSAYKLYLRFEEKSRNTVDKYMRDIRRFIAWWEMQTAEKVTEQAAENKDLAVCAKCEAKTGIGKDCVITYKKYLEENYKPDSVNSMLVALDGFFM